MDEELLKKLGDVTIPTRRVRRKAMDVETWARFCNAASVALTNVYAMFDPSQHEVELMLEFLRTNAKHNGSLSRRRTQ